MNAKVMVLVLAIIFVNGVSGKKKKKDTKLNLPEGAKCNYGKYNGTCVKYYRCLSVLDLVKSNKSLPALCSYDDLHPVICCADCELTEDARNAVSTTYAGLLLKNKGKAHDKCIEHLSSLSYDCKKHNTVNYGFRWNKKKKCKEYSLTAIAPVGGEDARRAEFPHMALLGYGQDLQSAQWQCAGSLISDRFILTAAHCIASSLLGPVKYIGLGMLKRSDPEALWQKHEVKRIIPHPEYHSPSKYNDIALLETDRPVNFTDFVLPACLHTSNETIFHLHVHAAGWGNLGHQRPLADVLQRVSLEKFSAEECGASYGPHRHLRRGFDRATQMCYGHHKEAKDTCSGDSGGPLEVYSNMDCQFRIFGVTSAGIECGRPGNAGLYTRVDHYIPWIESVVWP